MRRLILALFVLFVLFSRSTYAETSGFKYGKEAVAAREAYFKAPQKQALILIETVYEYDGHVAPDVSKEITLSMRSGDSSNTANTRTPVAIVIPMSMFEEAGASIMKLPVADRDAAWLLVPPMTVSVVAQSRDRICGLKGTVYYEGKEIMVNNSSVGYGIVDIAYNLPLKEYFKSK